jgi:Mitochondrial domain of unknown function (DUF1713)
MPLDQHLYGWRGRARTSNLLIQSQAFCRLNYPPRAAPRYLLAPARSPRSRRPGNLTSAMGSLIKKRRKRMRKKKHKKMLKATRWQRRAGK